MIVSAMDMLPQSPDTVFLFTGGNSYTKPSISMVVENTISSGRLVKNRYWCCGFSVILANICSRHSGFQWEKSLMPVRENSVGAFSPSAALIGKKLRLFKVVDHVKPTNIVSGVAVAATNSTADHQIHVLNTVFNTNSHR